ncbi:hypothetical protein [Alteromonas pelagimontana]|nr:hypothetical protein [Alteromonas pelagimontana]
MADNSDFKEAFNGWYVLAIIAVLLAFSLLHVIVGWFTFWL